MFNLERRARKPSLLACLGALLAAVSIGLSAYASHGVADPLAQQHLNMAALYAFAHGAVLVALRLPWRLRLAGVAMMLPLLWPAVPRPPAGEFELLAPDVGQGNAVLVRTRGHVLLFDTGPVYAPGADAGERVLLPLLRSLGVGRLDMLVLSHRDSDHVGGAATLLRCGVTVPGGVIGSARRTRGPFRGLMTHPGCRGRPRRRRYAQLPGMQASHPR